MNNSESAETPKQVPVSTAKVDSSYKRTVAALLIGIVLGAGSTYAWQTFATMQTQQQLQSAEDTIKQLQEQLLRTGSQPQPVNELVPIESVSNIPVTSPSTSTSLTAPTNDEADDTLKNSSITTTPANRCVPNSELSFHGLPDTSPTGQWCLVSELGACQAVWCNGYWMDTPTLTAATVLYDCNARKSDSDESSCRKMQKPSITPTPTTSTIPSKTTTLAPTPETPSSGPASDSFVCNNMYPSTCQCSKTGQTCQYQESIVAEISCLQCP